MKKIKKKKKPSPEKEDKREINVTEFDSVMKKILSAPPEKKKITVTQEGGKRHDT